MDSIATDVVALLRYLLPGFLAAWVYYEFTSFEKPAQFERVVQALIFTLFIRGAIDVARAMAEWSGLRNSSGNWSPNVELSAAVVVALLLGFAFAYCSNNDTLHAWVRKAGITRETSYPSEWFGEFSKNVTFVVLHLVDGRRLYGWPREWPSNPKKGHFSLQQASWLDGTEERPLVGVNTVMVRAEDVELIEFMEKTWET